MLNPQLTDTLSADELAEAEYMYQNLSASQYMRWISFKAKAEAGMLDEFEMFCGESAYKAFAQENEESIK